MKDLLIKHMGGNQTVIVDRICSLNYIVIKYLKTQTWLFITWKFRPQTLNNYN